MNKRNPAPAGPLPSIFARALTNDRGKMSLTVARWILTWGFGQADQDRMADLAERNQAGALSPAEKAELKECVDVGHLVAQFHAIAGTALKRPRSSKA